MVCVAVALSRNNHSRCHCIVLFVFGPQLWAHVVSAMVHVFIVSQSVVEQTCFRSGCSIPGTGMLKILSNSRSIGQHDLFSLALRSSS